MASNQQLGTISHSSSISTAIQDIPIAPSYVPHFSHAGASRPPNGAIRLASNPPLHPSGLIPDNMGTVYPNAPWLMPIQRTTQPFQAGPVNRNTGIPLASMQSSDLGELQLKRKLSTMLQSEQLELFESNTGECQVVCGDRSWKVHGHIVGPRCNFFAAAMRWKKEEDDKIIDMSGDDPQAVDILLRYLYTRNGALVGDNTRAIDQRAQLLVKIALVADKYDQADLLAQVKIELSKWSLHVNQLKDLGEGARDAMLALIRLRELDTASEPLQQLQTSLFRFLRDSRQLHIMDKAMATLLQKAIPKDPDLAIALIVACSAGPSHVPSS